MIHPMEERYKHDPLIHGLVDSMVAMIEQLRFTPSEMREAAMLACIIYENTRIRPPMFIRTPDGQMPI